MENGWIESEPIYINTEIKKTISNSFAIPLDGHTVMTLHSDDYVLQILLSSMVENSTRVLIVSTQFVVTNFTDYKIEVWPFTAESNEKVGLIPKSEYQSKQFVVLNNNVKRKPE